MNKIDDIFYPVLPPSGGSGGGSSDATKIKGVPVDIAGMQDGHVLTYDATLGKFVPKPKPAGGGDFQSVLLNINPGMVSIDLDDANTTVYGNVENIISKYCLSNTSPYFNITRSSATNSTTEPWYMWSATNNYWRPNTISNEWSKIDLVNSYSVRRVMIKFNSGDYAPLSFLLESSNDDINYVTQYSGANLTKAFWSSRIVAPVLNMTPYRYWRVTLNGMATNATGSYFMATELSLSLT